MMRQTPDAPSLLPESLLSIPEHPNVQQEGTTTNAKPHNELDFDAEDEEIDEYVRVTGKTVTRKPNGEPYSPRSPPSASSNPVYIAITSKASYPTSRPPEYGGGGGIKVSRGDTALAKSLILGAPWLWLLLLALL
jgi:hypothetical protein